MMKFTHKIEITVGKTFDKDGKAICANEAVQMVDRARLMLIDQFGAYTEVPTRGCYRDDKGTLVYDLGFLFTIYASPDNNDALRAAAARIRACFRQSCVVLSVTQVSAQLV